VFLGAWRRNGSGGTFFAGMGRSDATFASSAVVRGLKESAFYFWKRTIADRDREKKASTKSRGKAAGMAGRVALLDR
jgi:hypothetical protein